MVAGFAACAAIAANPAAGGPVLWIDDSGGNIGTVDVETGDVTVIGSAGVVLTDIAFDPDGNLWGIDFSSLYTIDKSTGDATLVGSTGVTANALVFGADGTLYAAGGTNLYSLDVDTGDSTLLGNTGSSSAGDLAFHDGELYLSSLSNELVRIELTPSVSGTVVGPFGFSNVFGLAQGDDEVLYGASGTTIFSVDVTTGAGTLASNYGGQGLLSANGTAFVEESGSPPPPPPPPPNGVIPLPAGVWLGLVALGGMTMPSLHKRLRHARRRAGRQA